MKKKELERRFGALAENLVGYVDHIDFRFFDDFNDEAFAFLMKNVKGVNMLDLNETNITNESIEFLTNLEYVNEIRARQCENLTDDCSEDLNKLTQLTFLHLRSTSITIDGLLNLKDLTNLKTLLFSAEETLSKKEKLLDLKLMHLPCEMVIDSKPYYYNSIDLFLHFLKDSPYLFRLKIRNTNSSEEWSTSISSMDKNFIKAEFQGIHSVDDIEWIEIKSSAINFSEESEQFPDLIKLLECLEFPFEVENGILSTYILDKEVY